MSAASVPASRAIFALLVAGTILGFAGTDLVLPAVPILPETLGGGPAHAQFVLAAYVAGFSVGLIAFGALGDRFSATRLLVVSTAAFAATSFGCALAPNIGVLVAMRFAHGAAASAAAVFVPGIVRRLYDAHGAVRALGTVGSIEALTPALAPLAGAWLLDAFGWRSGFAVCGALGLAVAAAFVAFGKSIPQPPTRGRSSYADLLADREFVRHALSQACVVGGLLVIVFGAPGAFVHAMGGGVSDFIAMQVAGVACFIACASLSARLVRRFGADATIRAGTALGTLAAGAILVAAAFGATPTLVIALFAPLNAGLGLRGPPGFLAALEAAGENDARGSALVVVAITGIAALGTAAAAPFVVDGMRPIAAMAFAIELLALIVLMLPRAAR